MLNKQQAEILKHEIHWRWIRNKQLSQHADITLYLGLVILVTEWLRLTPPFLAFAFTMISTVIRGFCIFHIERALKAKKLLEAYEDHRKSE